MLIAIFGNLQYLARLKWGKNKKRRSLNHENLQWDRELMNTAEESQMINNMLIPSFLQVAQDGMNLLPFILTPTL